jgi:predicted phage tail protein
LTVQGSLTTGPRIRLVFRDNQPNGANAETGFLVYRSDNEGPFTLLPINPPLGPRNGVGNVTYFDYAVTAGSTYEYYVVAINGTAASLPSARAIATLPPAPAAPATFTGTATRTNNTARVNLAWTDSSNNESRFVVQRDTVSTFNSANLFTSNRGANSTSWANTGLPRNTNFYYRIRAENQYGVSAWVNLVPFPIRTP